MHSINCETCGSTDFSFIKNCTHPRCVNVELKKEETLVKYAYETPIDLCMKCQAYGGMIQRCDHNVCPFRAWDKKIDKGCICPPGANLTCENSLCPRKSSRPY